MLFSSQPSQNNIGSRDYFGPGSHGNTVVCWDRMCGERDRERERKRERGALPFVLEPTAWRYAEDDLSKMLLAFKDAFCFSAPVEEKYFITQCTNPLKRLRDLNNSVHTPH